MLGETVDEVSMFLSKHDIPLKASTENLHTFIEKLDNASSDERIKELLEDDKKCEVYWQIVNSSHWPITEEIRLHNKTSLIQELIYNEVIRSRSELFK